MITGTKHSLGKRIENLVLFPSLHTTSQVEVHIIRLILRATITRWQQFTTTICCMVNFNLKLSNIILRSKFSGSDNLTIISDTGCWRISFEMLNFKYLVKIFYYTQTCYLYSSKFTIHTGFTWVHLIINFNKSILTVHRKLKYVTGSSCTSNINSCVFMFSFL